MSFIPLTKGRIALVDSLDFDFLVQVGSWCFGSGGYAIHYYTDEQGKRKVLYAHRLIMARMLGHAIPAGLQCDHTNQDRLDNRRENLRLATRSQNQANKGVVINNTSQYKGVNWSKGAYEVRIKYGNKRVYLGRFDEAMTAALVYDAASRYFYQEFAGCNFPEIATPPYIKNLLREALAKHRL